MNKKYKSDAFEAIHDTAQGLYEIEMLDTHAMDNFDKTCLIDFNLIKSKD